MPKETRDRLYYSISEVCTITDIRPHVLRYWESEFKELNPRKNRAGNRIYRDTDIKLILLIKHLLYEERYTIEGAKRKLSLMKDNGSMDNVSIVDLRAKQLLVELKQDLVELQEMLSQPHIQEYLKAQNSRKSSPNKSNAAP